LYDRCNGVLHKRRLPLARTVVKDPSDFSDVTLGYPAPATFQARNQSEANTQAVGKLYLRQAKSTAEVA
jgi:hypothetical protein